MADGFTLEVGGATLVAAPFAQLGVEQDGWITAALERAGLADPGLATLPPAARQAEVRLRILESGHISTILAGFLVAEGAPWTADGARRHAALCRGVTSVLERQLMHAMVEGLVQGFFAHGQGSETPTGKPSSAGAEDGSSPGSSGVAAADIGNRSSAPLPATIPTPSDGSSPGPSATPSAPTSST